MNLDAFTYITGIAGLLGLILQVRDIFPAHREARKNLVMILLGVFIGSLVSSLRSINVQLSTEISSYSVLVGAIVILIMFFSITATFSENQVKRGELYSAAFFGAIFLLLVLLFGGLLTGKLQSDGPNYREFTTEELLSLVSMNSEKGNYDRALHLIEGIKSNLSRTDTRYIALQKAQEKIKAEQIMKTGLSPNNAKQDTPKPKS